MRFSLAAVAVSALLAVAVNAQTYSASIALSAAGNVTGLTMTDDIAGLARDQFPANTGFSAEASPDLFAVSASTPQVAGFHLVQIFLSNDPASFCLFSLQSGGSSAPTLKLWAAAGLECIVADVVFDNSTGVVLNKEYNVMVANAPGSSCSQNEGTGCALDLPIENNLVRKDAAACGNMCTAANLLKKLAVKVTLAAATPCSVALTKYYANSRAKMCTYDNVVFTKCNTAVTLPKSMIICTPPA